MDELDPRNWVELFADDLFAFACYRVNDRENARDLVQETFLSGIKAVGGFKNESAVKTWLIAILRRKIIDHYRKNAQPSESISPNEVFSMDNEAFFTEDGFMPGEWKKSAQPSEWKIDPASEMEQKELKKILLNCIHKLPPQWMSIFSRKYLEDAGSDEICKEFELSPTNFWVIIHRAKLYMRSCLEKNWM